MGSIGPNGVGGVSTQDGATAGGRGSRRPRHAQPRPEDFNRDVPALVLKIGQYPVQSGPVAVMRTLGRLGVPVYAMTEPGITPAAASRYCAGRGRSTRLSLSLPERNGCMSWAPKVCGNVLSSMPY